MREGGREGRRGGNATACCKNGTLMLKYRILGATATTYSSSTSVLSQRRRRVGDDYSSLNS